MSKKKKGMGTTVALIIVLLVGLSVMLYPVISDWWNSRTQSRAIAVYQETVANLDDADCEKILAKAHEYNESLKKLREPFIFYDDIKDYYEILDITGTGIMGYVDIPQINVELPVYHGTSEGVLNIAVGHLQGSSLPVGGEGTHAVVSAHRGLPSAKLFSDLDELVVGDTFTITVLKEVYTYEVDKISIVEPSDMNDLLAVPGKDYITLMTCTPYGINSHRLLVRGHRIANAAEASQAKVTADALQLDPISVVPAVAAPLLLLLIIYWVASGRRNKKQKKAQASAMKLIGKSVVRSRRKGDRDDNNLV